MVGQIKRILKKNTGAVTIVEAAIVFPIMFIVLLTLIYMGNAYFIKEYAEATVTRYAVEGAEYCADPILKTVKANGGALPGTDKLSVKPYRYLFGGMDNVEKDIGAKVYNEISQSGSGFKNMKPKIKTSKNKIAKYHNYILFSSFSVDVEYSLFFPISFFNGNKLKVMELKAHSEVAVNDASEFIRNTDMVIDYFSDTKIGRSIESTFKKLNEFLNKFAKS